MSFLSATLGRIVLKYRTVAEWAETYSKVVEAKPIQEKTRANRRSYIRRIVEQMGVRRIGAVRPHEIGAYIGEVAAQHPHLARRMLIEVRDMFREAIAYGWIDRDPTVGVRTPRVRVARLRITFEQWRAMHAWSQQHQPPWVPRMLMLALITGQRRADLRKTTCAPPVGASMSWRFEQAREAVLPAVAGSADPPSLHECRSLAARMYDAQGVRDVQTLLGHSHASMTDLYKDDRGLDRRHGRWKIVAAA